MAPSISGILQKKKYFIILDKDNEHPRKKYFDVVCFEIIKDDPFYHELRYRERPFFTGLVLFDIETENGSFVPFKFWKRNLKATVPENALRVIDPTEFRNFILNAKFCIVGNHLNRPQGHQFENYQVVETEAHEVQKEQMDDYLKSLQPIYKYLENLQYTNIRNYLFCHSCKQEKRYTLIDEFNRYKNQAFFVCRKCAGNEIINSLKTRIEISSAFKSYLRQMLKRYNDVVKVLNIFSPNFDILAHREATLVNIKKKKIKSTEEKRQTIWDFPIPYPLQIYYSQKKRVELLPAQIMALEHGLLHNQDELIVSSTSSGKTMIGEMTGIGKIIENKIEILIKNQNLISPFPLQEKIKNIKPEAIQFSAEQQKFLKRMKSIKSSKKMLYLVPIVALANMRFQEYKELEKFGVKSALKIGISHISRKEGIKEDFGSLTKADVVIATYEAIDILLRSGHPFLLRDFRTVVVDEIQMLADPERGFILDGLIARLRLHLPKAQMLYLSATISDPEKLANHLRATLIHYKDRPVPIERHIVMCMDEATKFKHMRRLVREEYRKRSSFGYKGQTIVFTNSRKNTEKLAEQLRKNNIKAYAYHGGLDYGKRKFIEKSFELQKIACVVTTAALAAGVDFPASLVIFYNLTMGIQPLTVADFEQMSGRAGRLKKHDLGKVYLLITPGKSFMASYMETEEQLAIRLLKGEIEPLQLAPNDDKQYSEILAIISMYSYDRRPERGISKNNLRFFHSLLFNGEFHLKSAVKYLYQEKMIKPVYNNTEFRTTRFGKAVAESYLSLKQAIEIRNELIHQITEENPPADMLRLAQNLNSFMNVYVTNRMLAELSLKSERQSRSNNLFSNSVLSMIHADYMGKKHRTHINRRVYEVILRWVEDIFNCTCEDSPYCDCGRKNVEGFIFDYRLSGLTISEIIETFKEEFEIKIFPGDLIDYLERIIYSLLAIQKIGKSIAIPAQTMLRIKEIPKIINLLIGPRKNKGK
ncbi:MAG: DUF5814 domain-containing protein [Candidatus Lokiarchaeota archaeon]|nr:DUF5814 domain-containing protein [Candidatus Harpocratesius repetitus]